MARPAACALARVCVCFCWAACCDACSEYDLSAPCPQGWEEMHEGQCLAPLSYRGPCDALQAVGRDEKERRSLANQCAVEWPCLDAACERNYTAPCPSGWLHRGDGVCEAPPLYSGSCQKLSRMYGHAYKREFENRCGAQWPCARSCVRDLSVLCPTGWLTNNDDVCEAASSYTGPCLPFADLSSFTDIDKETFADLCQVEFCASPRRQSAADDCEPVESQTCPDGWVHLGSESGYCYGAQYQGPCRPVIAASELLNIGKRRYRDACGVSWPCRRKAVATFSAAGLSLS
mmetsp:Transcript_8898/g.24650  ORF Transcript_8898/g.24650 Transcript_8898/m.24650 type:complete len:289 (+) Transcript_8898:81-947(+)